MGYGTGPVQTPVSGLQQLQVPPDAPEPRLNCLNYEKEILFSMPFKVESRFKEYM